jgi:hypothetical protein
MRGIYWDCITFGAKKGPEADSGPSILEYIEWEYVKEMRGRLGRFLIAIYFGHPEADQTKT